MIKNTYELSRQPTVADVMTSDFISGFCKDTLKRALDMDSIDAMKDLEIVHAVMVKISESHLLLT